MVGLPYDCLANPLGAIRLTFQNEVASKSDPAPLDGRDWGTADLFRQFLINDNGLSQVPMLNASTIKYVQPNTLVRFRGMIQDMLGNELYVGAYKDGATWKTNKFSDASQCPMDASSDMRIWDRRLLYCIPVPGQNSWAKYSQENLASNHTNFVSPQREKRGREEENDIDMMDGDDIVDSSKAKKMREDGMASFESQTAGTEGTFHNSNLAPAAEINSLPCLIKIYDSAESDLKLNDVFEFVGIFTYDPDLVEDIDNDEFVDSICQEASVCVAPTKVPRLHCVLHRKLVINDFFASPPVELKPIAIRELREALIGYLTAILGNDRIAAQFILLHLLSMVHARVDTIAVGKLSLNLTCFNQESASVVGHRLKLAIKNLVPFTQFLPLTVDSLNTVSLAPKKDYNTDRLVPGFLQLPEGSHLTIDETPLQNGTLNSTGIENAQVLKNLLESQKVDYDFTYYKMEMAADVQLLIFSEGKSNILPADVVLPCRPCSVDSIQEIDAELLKAFRWYLASMKLLPHSIEQHMQKVVEDDIVAARQADRSLGSAEFSRWLTMGRLVSVSFGETSLSEEHWQMVKELEGLRKERLQGN